MAINNVLAVRIEKIVLENFKSVEYGEIEMACSRKRFQSGSRADILGVYGQNGSGKTSMIEALSILKYLMTGDSIPDSYADCIKVGGESSRLEYTFDVSFDDGRNRKVVYDVTLGKAQPYNSEELMIVFDEGFADERESDNQKSKHLVKVLRETVKVAGDFGEGKLKMQPIIDTEVQYPFGPVSKRKEFIDSVSELNSLAANRVIANKLSKSFIFMNETLQVFEKKKDNDFVKTIMNLRLFATAYLYVVDTKASGLIRLNVAFPIILRRLGTDHLLTRSRVLLNAEGPSKLPQELFGDIREALVNMNDVLGKLIPGLTIDLKDMGPVLSNTGKTFRYAELVANRDGVELPLRCESDGVKKIISTLQLFIEAYNDPSMTVAIDEFDAGVFEYLLGEMLKIFEDYGKGQFIFTSHNLRPLEVLNKNFICFTTTDPANRYVRLDNIKPNNNLRNVYFKEIELGGDEVDLYEAEKKYRVVQALRKAGSLVGQTDETKK